MVAGEHEWERIARDLLGKIQRGVYEPGAQLPTESELRVEYGVARNTAQRALTWLVGKGYVAPRSTRGVFVRSYDRQLVSAGLSAESREADARVEVGVVEPPAEVAARMPGLTEVWRRRAVRPGHLVDAYIAPELAERVPELRGPKALGDPHAVWLQRAGLEVEHQAVFVARMPTIEEEQLLELLPATPLLEQTSTVADAAGRVLVVRVDLYAGDRTALRANLAP
ncbi:GntR family transcriptional regulator [Streptosporangium sp. NPDC002524]|uniref:GntR family transcriptional regulator n=1 Tax=Streptosporangium sp. NPDC002524 TaxID=3154537 RepID=UPI003319C969